MRLVTYLRQDMPRLGALVDGDRAVVDIAGAAGLFEPGAPAGEFASMLDLIDGGPAALDRARRLVEMAAGEDGAPVTRPRESVRLDAPLPNPRRLRDCGCFLQHFRNARAVRYRRLAEKEPDFDAAMERFRAEGAFDIPKAWEENPLYLNANTLNIVGPDATIAWPNGSRRMDYELEWAIVTWGRGIAISQADAGAHIFGYTIFNDVSARDIQAQDIRAGIGLGGRSKDFDTGNVLGPCIVTADEFADPYALKMEVRVNGEVRGGGSTGQMDHRFEAVIAYASELQTVHPGEIFGSGTVPSGCGLEGDRYLEDGDLIELEVEGIGVLANRIAKPAGWRDRQSPDSN